MRSWCSIFDQNVADEQWKPFNANDELFLAFLCVWESGIEHHIVDTSKKKKKGDKIF